ncbi:MAG: FtsW/RodA/SpoVE family cell cycle protein [Lachnospiraceae bacterium]
MFRKYRFFQYKLRNYDFKLVFFVCVLCCIGLVVVKSATADIVADSSLSIFQKQMIGIIVGIIAMIIVSLIDYHYLIKCCGIIYIINMLLLLYVEFFGKNLNGAQRWIVLPGFGTLQPSEFSKLALIVLFATYLSKFKNKINNIVYLLILAALAMPPLLLILSQPDLSTTLVCLFILIVMIFLAGISYKWVFGVLAVMVPVACIFSYLVVQPGETILNKIFAEHQMERILSFLNPEDYPDLMYQQNYSVMAIAGGQLTGKGLNNATFDSVKNGNFLSEEQCDFIFAVVGEELGFIGSCAILLLIFIIVFECLRVAKKAKDVQGQLIAGGVAGLFAFQSFVNIGVATRIIPNTGLPLPFISAGLSSLLSSFMAIGMVLNVRLQRRNMDY